MVVPGDSSQGSCGCQAAFPHQDFPRSLRETLTRLTQFSHRPYILLRAGTALSQFNMNRPTAEKEKDFHHPYEPYDIQKKFMNALYECIEDGKVGIFESPTGEEAISELLHGPRADGPCRNGKSFCFGLLCYFSLKPSLHFFHLNNHKSKLAYSQTNLYQSYRIFSKSPIC